jgi:hypothetical protein
MFRVICISTIASESCIIDVGGIGSLTICNAVAGIKLLKADDMLLS